MITLHYSKKGFRKEDTKKRKEEATSPLEGKGQREHPEKNPQGKTKNNKENPKNPFAPLLRGP